MARGVYFATYPGRATSVTSDGVSDGIVVPCDPTLRTRKPASSRIRAQIPGGAWRDRTADLRNAITRTTWCDGAIFAPRRPANPPSFRDSPSETGHPTSSFGEASRTPCFRKFH